MTAVESRAYALIKYIALAGPPLELSPSEIDRLIFKTKYRHNQQPEKEALLRVLGCCGAVCKAKFSDEDKDILREQGISPELIELWDGVFQFSSIPDDYSEEYVQAVSKAGNSSWETRFSAESW